MPEIPQIVDGELRDAVSALARAAFMMRGVFVQAAEGKPIAEILAERGDYLELAEGVINQWCAYFGIDGEENTIQ